MNVGLLGFGTVGSGVVKILDMPQSDLCQKIKVKYILVRDLKGRTDPRLVTDYNRILQDDSIDTILECMGGDEPAYTYARQAIVSGRHFISSNKKMIALHLDELSQLAAQHHVSLGYEATTGGGIPCLSTLRQLRLMEPVHSVRGVLNGTTNYILDLMNRTTDSFSEALAKAQKAGYAEADPRDDTYGYDIRNKVCIASAEAFDILLNVDSVVTFGLQNLQRRDLNYAMARHRIIKFTGETSLTPDGVAAHVCPVMIPQTDPFAHVRRNLNIVSFTSDALGTLMLEGQGAGSLPTAHAMVQDACQILKKAEFHQGRITRADAIPSAERKIWYIRSHHMERYPEKFREDLDDETILSLPSTPSQIRKNMEALGDPQTFAMEIY